MSNFPLPLVAPAALLAVACAIAPTTAYRLPPTPSAYWIWPDLAEATLWQREHPTVRLCVSQVPDGFATEGC